MALCPTCVQCAYCEVDCNAKVAAMLQAAVTYDRPILDLKENLATATPAVPGPCEWLG